MLVHAKLNVISDLQRKLTLRSSIEIHCAVWELNGPQKKISDNISYKYRLWHTYITHITLLALLLQHVSALKRPSSGSTTDTFSKPDKLCKIKVKFTL